LLRGVTIVPGVILHAFPEWPGITYGKIVPARAEKAAMNLIAKLLPPSNVVLDLDVTSKKRMFEQAGLLFENNQGVARSLVFDSLFARERLGSTGLGHGVAIPHGRIKGLKEAVGAFVRLAQPVPFDAPDGKPVTLVFVLLVPEQATERHLQILSELAQMFGDRELRERLATDSSAGALHQHITEWQPHVPDQRRAAV
jgi:PTS system nitrogen regulatory IIA component